LLLAPTRLDNDAVAHPLQGPTMEKVENLYRTATAARNFYCVRTTDHTCVMLDPRQQREPRVRFGMRSGPAGRSYRVTVIVGSNHHCNSDQDFGSRGPRCCRVVVAVWYDMSVSASGRRCAACEGRQAAKVLCGRVQPRGRPSGKQHSHCAAVLLHQFLPDMSHPPQNLAGCCATRRFLFTFLQSFILSVKAPCGATERRLVCQRSPLIEGRGRLAAP